MWSLASDSQDTGMSGSLGGRVGSEDLQELAALLDLVENGPDVIGIAVALEVDEVHVLPGAPLGWSRFDLGQVEPARGEGLEDAVQHAGLVLHREEDGGLVPPRRADQAPSDHQETRGVVRVVLDALLQHGYVVRPGGQLRGDRRHRRVVLGALRRRRRRRHLLGAGVGQVGQQPLPALRERLRVGADDLDLAELAGPRQQVLADLERELARDQGLRVDEAVEGDVDGPLGRVLDRHHAVLRAPPLALLEDIRDALERDEVGGRAETAHRRRVRESARGTEVPAGQRILEGERGREDLPPDGADRLSAQGAPIQRREALEDLRLALRDKVRPVLLPLELADLKGGVSALVEKVEDLLVEVVDPGSPVVQVHEGLLMRIYRRLFASIGEAPWWRTFRSSSSSAAVRGRGWPRAGGPTRGRA